MVVGRGQWAVGSGSLVVVSCQIGNSVSGKLEGRGPRAKPSAFSLSLSLSLWHRSSLVPFRSCLSTFHFSPAAETGSGPGGVALAFMQSTPVVQLAD